MSSLSVRALPVLAVAVAAAVVAWRERGSIAAPDWLPFAVLVALVAATVAAAGVARRPPRALGAGAAALALLAAWMATTIAWAPSPAGARDEALLTLLYAIALVLPGLAVAGEGERRVAAGLVAGTIGTLGALVALDLALAGTPASFFFFGRLNFPVSYVNATSALFVLALWPALVLAAERAARPLWRMGGMATAGVVLALALAAQSKGTIVGLVVSALAVFALAPNRLRLLPPLLLAAAPTAVLAVPLTAPYRTETAAAQTGVGASALVAAAAAAGLGALWIAVDRRVEVAQRTRAAVGRALLLLLVAAVAIGVAAFAVTVPSPSSWASAKWQAFKHPGGGGSTHLTSLGSNRYDFWRVALDETRAHPLRGLGARGFYSAYLRERRSPETPLRAHSLYLDVLSEEGVPGLLLLLAGLGVPLFAVARRRRHASAVAAFGAAAYLLVHAAVDWVWTVPVVAVPALLLLGIGAARDDDVVLPRAASIGAGAVGVLVAVFAFAPPWLAYRYVTAAYRSSDPAADLSRARSLDPLTLEPDWAEWRLVPGQRQKIAALERALHEEPHSVAVLYQLGLEQEHAGLRAAARSSFSRALALDPHDEAVRAAAARSTR